MIEVSTIVSIFAKDMVQQKRAITIMSYGHGLSGRALAERVAPGFNPRIVRTVLAALDRGLTSTPMVASRCSRLSIVRISEKESRAAFLGSLRPSVGAMFKADATDSAPFQRLHPPLYNNSLLRSP